jgi:hypothetical protein
MSSTEDTSSENIVKSESETSANSKLPIINRSKRKQFRQRKLSDNSDDEDNIREVSSKLEEMKELQNLRKRPNGVNVLGLALGTSEDECVTVSTVVNLRFCFNFVAPSPLFLEGPV